MKTHSLLTFFICLLPLTLPAQYLPTDIVLSIGERQTTAGEFERIYTKNYNINTAQKQGVTDYFELFLRYKLKVSAALDAGMDTLSSYKKELKGYRDQLAKTYLTDTRALDSLVREAYNHTCSEVNVSHILILFPENYTSADTLAAFRKIAEIQKKLKSGEPFEKLAKEYSNDPSVKENGGNLGYFSAFRFPYLFEACAYNTKAGEISRPLRTSYGYHLIKVNDIRPSRGELKVAHIMIAVPRNAADSIWQKAKVRINGIYEQLRKGDDFANMAKQFSDDHNSANAGGELAWFGTARMVPGFEEAAFALKSKGDISLPVKTPFGWHIIKLIDKRDIPPFDQVKSDLKNKILNDERAGIVKAAFVEKLKKQYLPQTYPENLKIFNSPDSSVYTGTINIGEDSKEKPLIVLKDKSFTIADFKAYLEANPVTSKKIPVSDYIDRSFKKFFDESLLQYEDQRLETKYPDFGNLIGEYHDGILLFDVMDQEVWSKASHDSTGLIDFYSRSATKPMWDQRLDASVYNCSTKEIALKVKKLITSSKYKNITDEQLKKMVCDSVAGKDCVAVEHKLYSKGEQQFLDSAGWKTGVTGFTGKGNHTVFAMIWKIRPSEPKNIEDVKGLVIADYQNYLEEKWINELKNKYKIVVNQDLLNKIANKYKSVQ